MEEKERMERAKKLIQGKRYEEARELLTGIDHPRAENWLVMIDDALREQSGQLSGSKTVVPGWMLMVGLFVVAVIVYLVILLLVEGVL